MQQPTYPLKTLNYLQRLESCIPKHAHITINSFQVSTVPGKSRLIVAIAKQSQVVMPIVLQGDLKYLSHIQQQDRGMSAKLPLHKSKLVYWKVS